MAPSIPLQNAQLAEQNADYDDWKPEDLFDLWVSPAEDSIRDCNLAAVFDITYSSLAGSVVKVTAAGGASSKFVVNDENIIVAERNYNGDLRILLYTLFRMYQRAKVGHLKIKFNKTNIFHRLKPQLEPLHLAVDGLHCRNLELEYANQQRVWLEPLYPFLRAIRVEERIDFCVNAIEFPYEILVAPEVCIKNGDRIPFRIFEMNFRTAFVSNSPWNDCCFNQLIHEWLESKNDRLEMLVIGASSVYNRKSWDHEGTEYLLDGLQVEEKEMMGFNQKGEQLPVGKAWQVRRGDGVTADFLRTAADFVFKVQKEGD